MAESSECNKTLAEGMKNYLQIFKYPSVEKTAYDRCEQILNNEIMPYIGDKIISTLSAADIKKLINQLTEKVMRSQQSSRHTICSASTSATLNRKISLAKILC